MRHALVTGGTRGIGLAIARRLAQDGFTIHVTYAHDEAAAQLAQTMAQAEGLPLQAVRCDVTRSADWQRLLGRGTLLYEEGVQVLVHAAGHTHDGLMMFVLEADFAEMIDVHLKGGYLAVQAVMRGMIAARGGRILFITSPTAALGRPGQGSYGAAKAGLGGLMRSLVHEVSRFQITVNCVCAGLVDTAMTADLSEKVRQDLVAGVPLGRPGRPEEIAAAVAWLASDRAAYVTGQTMFVDGGLTTPPF